MWSDDHRDDPDGSPVTAADHAADRIARERIAERYPSDGLVTEESDEVIGASGRRWIVDPSTGRGSSSKGCRSGAS